MNDMFLGCIKFFGFYYAPVDWAMCDGQLLKISDHSTLFALLGTKYGGDGITTFGVPDLRGRSPIHVGHGPGLSEITWSQQGGTETKTIDNTNMPMHYHHLRNGDPAKDGFVAKVVTTTKVNVGDAVNINETDYGNFPFASGGTTPPIYVEQSFDSQEVNGVVSDSVITGNTEMTGVGGSFNIRNPFLGVTMCISLKGLFPQRP